MVHWGKLTEKSCCDLLHAAITRGEDRLNALRAATQLSITEAELQAVIAALKGALGSYWSHVSELSPANNWPDGGELHFNQTQLAQMLAAEFNLGVAGLKKQLKQVPVTHRDGKSRDRRYPVPVPSSVRRRASAAMRVIPSDLALDPASLSFIMGKDALAAEQVALVEQASEFLWCTGSRSRTGSYLHAIEHRLEEVPGLIHYRVLYGQPHRAEFREHLFRLIQIRDPLDWSLNCQSLCISVVDPAEDCFWRHEPEHFIVASENRVIVGLPSPNGIGKWDAALCVTDPDVARAYGRRVEALFRKGHPIERKADVERLRPLVE